MAIPKALTPEQRIKLNELYGNFKFAVANAADCLDKEGMDSEAFKKADHVAGELSDEINRLLGRKSRMS